MKELACKLPGVLSAELRRDEDGMLREIHVLSDLSRAPKQTVRDIQSALSAKYALTVDHRIISVAQIPAELVAKNAARRVKYAGLDVFIGENDCRIRVRLTDGEKEYGGEAAGGVDRLSRYHCAAAAAAAALNVYLDARAAVRLGEVRLTEIPGGTAVMCSVAYGGRERTELLVGSCIDRDDGGVSAVRALLDAVNRKIAYQ